MGYLGAQERPTDPTSGLIQMGGRPYAPELGAFASEDPLLGQPGVGATLDRYPYAWDNPLNRYDLSGRDVCSTAGEVPLIGPALEGGCHIITYRPPGQKTPLEEAEELGDRAAEFLKHNSQLIGTLGVGCGGGAAYTFEHYPEAFATPESALVAGLAGCLGGAFIAHEGYPTESLPPENGVK